MGRALCTSFRTVCGLRSNGRERGRLRASGSGEVHRETLEIRRARSGRGRLREWPARPRARAGRFARLQCFLPAGCAQASTAPGLRPGKPNSGIGVERSLLRGCSNSQPVFLRLLPNLEEQTNRLLTVLTLDVSARDLPFEADDQIRATVRIATTIEIQNNIVVPAPWGGRWSPVVSALEEQSGLPARRSRLGEPPSVSCTPAILL